MAAEKASQSHVVVVLDVETTGLKDDDRVVQIACLKIDQNGTKTAWTRYINPQMAFERQREAQKLHKIAPESLTNKPTFEKIADNLLKFLDDVDIILCHNALFDWSMLWNEFRRIKHPNAQDFAGKFQWLDILRLSILHYQHRFKPTDYRLVTLKYFMNVNTESLAAELNGCADDSSDTWRKEQHDAMYDVFTTYGILKHCMMNMDVHTLLQTHPNALLDTSLFIDMQKLRDEKRTSHEDLMPFVRRAKEYFTTARPRGKVLKQLERDFLLRMTHYHEEDCRTDRRIVLIYRAAYLDPPYEMPPESILQRGDTQEPQHALSDACKTVPTKDVNQNKEYMTSDAYKTILTKDVNQDKDNMTLMLQREDTQEPQHVLSDTCKTIPVKAVNQNKEDITSTIVNPQPATQDDASFEAIGSIVNENIKGGHGMTAIKKLESYEEKTDLLQIPTQLISHDATNGSNTKDYSSHTDKGKPKNEKVEKHQELLNEKVRRLPEEKKMMTSSSLAPQQVFEKNEDLGYSIDSEVKPQHSKREHQGILDDIVSGERETITSNSLPLKQSFNENLGHVTDSEEAMVQSGTGPNLDENKCMTTTVNIHKEDRDNACCVEEKGVNDVGNVGKSQMDDGSPSKKIKLLG